MNEFTKLLIVMGKYPVNKFRVNNHGSYPVFKINTWYFGYLFLIAFFYFNSMLNCKTIYHLPI